MSRSYPPLIAITFAAVSLAVIATPGFLTAQQPSAPAAASSPVASQQPYHIVDHWKVAGDGGWDYPVADPGAHRLYIAHGTEVDVVDTNTGKSIGTIPNLHGVHSIRSEERS